MAGRGVYGGDFSMSTNRHQTTGDRKAKAFLTTFVWAPASENECFTVILVVKDVF